MTAPRADPLGAVLAAEAELADVVADQRRLPAPLQGGLATIACVGSALPAEDYRRLLAEAS